MEGISRRHGDTVKGSEFLRIQLRPRNAYPTTLRAFVSFVYFVVPNYRSHDCDGSPGHSVCVRYTLHTRWIPAFAGMTVPAGHCSPLRTAQPHSRFGLTLDLRR